MKLDQRDMAGVTTYSRICLGHGFIGAFENLQKAASAYHKQSGDIRHGVCLS